MICMMDFKFNNTYLFNNLYIVFSLIKQNNIMIKIFYNLRTL